MKTLQPKTDPLLVACAALPVAGLLALYSYVLRARLVLGGWPAPYRPDPKDLGLALHHGAVGLLLEAAVLSPIGLGVWALLRRSSRGRTRPALGALSAYSAAYLALWLLLWADPGSFVEWYFD